VLDAVYSKKAKVYEIKPGAWQLRLPLPSDVVTHSNVYAISTSEGLLLIDCGASFPSSKELLDSGLRETGFSLADVSKLVCTHAHSDHYGQAADIQSTSNCSVHISPKHVLTRRDLVDLTSFQTQQSNWLRSCGVPTELVERHLKSISTPSSAVTDLAKPFTPLLDGSQFETDIGTVKVIATPGHCQCHMSLYAEDSSLVFTGDHLMKSGFLYFEHSPDTDPVAQYLNSLKRVEPLKVSLCLPGHGSPFTNYLEVIESVRSRISSRLALITELLSDSPATTYQLLQSLPDPQIDIKNYYAPVLHKLSGYLVYLENTGQITRSTSSIDGSYIWSKLPS